MGCHSQAGAAKVSLVEWPHENGMRFGFNNIRGDVARPAVISTQSVPLVTFYCHALISPHHIEGEIQARMRISASSSGASEKSAVSP